MKKYTLMFLGVFSAVAMSACGPDNVAACTENVEAVNALECIDDDTSLDVETQCPESLNDSTEGLDVLIHFNQSNIDFIK